MKRTGLRPPLIARYVGRTTKEAYVMRCSRLGNARFV
jgi:hypothetical protein